MEMFHYRLRSGQFESARLRNTIASTRRISYAQLRNNKSESRQTEWKIALEFNKKRAEKKRSTAPSIDFDDWFVCLSSNWSLSPRDDGCMAKSQERSECFPRLPLYYDNWYRFGLLMSINPSPSICLTRFSCLSLRLAFPSERFDSWPPEGGKVRKLLWTWHDWDVFRCQS